LKNKRLVGLVSLVAIALALLACDAGDLVAMVNQPTETPTRTLRPTFTPRPAVTPTSEETPTPQATNTSSASPTATKRVVATTRPATPKPAATAPPPPPQFAWKVLASDGSHGKCDAGPSTYEIKGRVWGPSTYVGGIHVVLLDNSGKVVAQMDSRSPEELNPEWNVSCFESKNLFNYQLDASAARNSGPLTLRLTKSAGDLTPISPNVTVIFDASGGRYYIDFIQ
jgi:hypothetical protein